MAKSAKRARAAKPAAAAKSTSSSLGRKLSSHALHHGTLKAKPRATPKKAEGRAKRPKPAAQLATQKTAADLAQLYKDARRQHTGSRHYDHLTVYKTHTTTTAAAKKTTATAKKKTTAARPKTRQEPTRYGATARHKYSHHTGPKAAHSARSAHRPHNGTSHYDQYL